MNGFWRFPHLVVRFWVTAWQHHNMASPAYPTKSTPKTLWRENCRWHLSLYIYIYTHIYIHIYIYTLIYIYIHTSIHPVHLYIYTSTSTHTHTHAYAYIYIYIYIFVYFVWLQPPSQTPRAASGTCGLSMMYVWVLALDIMVPPLLYDLASKQGSASKCGWKWEMCLGKQGFSHINIYKPRRFADAGKTLLVHIKN